MGNGDTVPHGSTTRESGTLLTQNYAETPSTLAGGDGTRYPITKHWMGRPGWARRCDVAKCLTD